MGRRGCWVLVCAFIAGCGGASNLSGGIEGRRWSFVQGSARKLASSDAFIVDLYGVAYPTCASSPEVDEVRLEHLPAAVGHYPLSREVTILFSGGDDITLDQNGAIDVDQLSATSLAGYLDAVVEPKSQTGTWATGHFRVDICP